MTLNPRVFDDFDMRNVENARDLTLNPLEAPFSMVMFGTKMPIKV